MPSQILPFTTASQTYSRLSRQIDCDLILSRTKSSLDDSDLASLQYDKTYREYKAKREGRRQRLINRGCIAEQPVDKVQVEARNIVDKESHIQEEAKAELLSDELKQWIKKIKSTQIELEYCTENSFGCLNAEVVAGAKSYEPYPDMERESFSYKGGKYDRSGCMVLVLLGLVRMAQQWWGHGVMEEERVR